MLFRMNHPVSKFYMLALAALFAVVVSGCSSSGGGSDPVSMAPPTTPEPETPVEPRRPHWRRLTELETAQAALTEDAIDGGGGCGGLWRLGDARTAVHAATSLPANQIAALNSQITKPDSDALGGIGTVNTMAMQCGQRSADAIEWPDARVHGCGSESATSVKCTTACADSADRCGCARRWTIPPAGKPGPAECRIEISTSAGTGDCGSRSGPDGSCDDESGRHQRGRPSATRPGHRHRRRRYRRLRSGWNFYLFDAIKRDRTARD